MILGSALVVYQLVFEQIKITPSLPYPVAFTLTNVGIVLGTIFGLGLIASKIASSRINKSLLSLN